MTIKINEKLSATKGRKHKLTPAYYMQHIICGIQQIGKRIVRREECLHSMNVQIECLHSMNVQIVICFSRKEFFKTPLSKLEIQTTHTTAFLMEPEEVGKLVPT